VNKKCRKGRYLENTVGIGMTKKNGGAEKVFKVTFRCHNCGNIWSEYYGRGDEIETAALGYYLRDHRDFGLDTCHSRRIECPVCGLFQDISVIVRKPIQNEP
jgi:rubredoxin